MSQKMLIFATPKGTIMEKLDFKAISGSTLSFHYNEHIAIFNDFEEVRKNGVYDVLVEGFLIVVVTHGQAQVSIGDKPQLLGAGDVFTCKPRNIFERGMMSMDFNAMMLFLSPEYVGELTQMIRLEWTHSMISSSHQVLHADEQTLNRFRLYFDLLQNHLSRPDAVHKETSLRLLLASMAYDLADLRRNSREVLIHQRYSSGENILSQFLTHLHDPSQPFLSVCEYATLLSVTPKYFSSICKRLTGKTANQLISDEIVRSSQIALRDSSKSIKQVSAMMGFKNQSHFGRFFRQQTGLSPLQYREGKTIG